jgi:integrase-like protein
VRLPGGAAPRLEPLQSVSQLRLFGQRRRVCAGARESCEIGLLWHGRRRILWLGVTAHPSAEWMARQLTEACGWEWNPSYIVRDRDRVYGEIFTRRLRAMGIRDRPTAPRSPWQNGHTERLIGSIRRECLDHVVVFGERHLRHLLLILYSVTMAREHTFP